MRSSYIILSVLSYSIRPILSHLPCFIHSVLPDPLYPIIPILSRLSCPNSPVLPYPIRPIFSVCLIPSLLSYDPVCPVLSSQLFPSSPSARLVPFVSPHRSCFIRSVSSVGSVLGRLFRPASRSYTERLGAAGWSQALSASVASQLPPTSHAGSLVGSGQVIGPWRPGDSPLAPVPSESEAAAEDVPPPPSPPQSSPARLTRRDRDLYRETRRGVAAVGAGPGVVSGVSAACLSTSHRATVRRTVCPNSWQQCAVGAAADDVTISWQVGTHSWRAGTDSAGVCSCLAAMTRQRAARNVITAKCVANRKMCTTPQHYLLQTTDM